MDFIFKIQKALSFQELKKQLCHLNCWKELIFRRVEYILKSQIVFDLCAYRLGCHSFKKIKLEKKSLLRLIQNFLYVFGCLFPQCKIQHYFLNAFGILYHLSK